MEHSEAVEQELLDTDLPDLIDSAARYAVIETQADAEDAVGLLDIIVDRRQQVEAWFKPLVENAHRAWKALTVRRADVLGQFAAPEQAIRRALGAYHAAREAERREAEAAAERERQRFQEEARLARAQRALDRGDDAQAERILDGRAPEPVLAAVVVPEPTRLEGVAFVKTVRAEVFDLALLIKAAAEHPHFVPLLQANQTALNQMARALGDALDIPGVRLVTGASVRRSA